MECKTLDGDLQERFGASLAALTLGLAAPSSSGGFRRQGLFLRGHLLATAARQACFPRWWLHFVSCFVPQGRAAAAATAKGRTQRRRQRAAAAWAWAWASAGRRRRSRRARRSFRRATGCAAACWRSGCSTTPRRCWRTGEHGGGLGLGGGLGPVRAQKQVTRLVVGRLAHLFLLPPLWPPRTHPQVLPGDGAVQPGGGARRHAPGGRGGRRQAGERFC